MNYAEYVVCKYSQSSWAKPLRPAELRHTRWITGYLDRNTTDDLIAVKPETRLFWFNMRACFYCCQPSVRTHTHKPEDTAVQSCTHTCGQYRTINHRQPSSASRPTLLSWPKVDFAVSVFTSVWCRGCMPRRLNQKDRGQGGIGVHCCTQRVYIHAHTVLFLVKIIKTKADF